MLNSIFRERELEYNWHDLISDYAELTNFRLRAHPDTNAAQQMDFILTVNRRGLMWWDERKEKTWKEDKLKEIEEKEEAEMERTKSKEIKQNWTARNKLNRSSRKFELIKKLYDKEMEWTLASLSFNPLWPTFN